MNSSGAHAAGQCCSAGNNFGRMTFITRPPLVRSCVARKLFASIDTLRLSHLYILYFAVWDFTNSLFSRRLVRGKAKGEGRPASSPPSALGEEGAACLLSGACFAGSCSQSLAALQVSSQSDSFSFTLQIPSWMWSSPGVAAGSLQGGSLLPAAGLQDWPRFLPRKALGFV